ncbi:MAG: hypothetical protein GY716_16050 [bacterium]|nr:hypothetical protein [bacterium]
MSDITFRQFQLELPSLTPEQARHAWIRLRCEDPLPEAARTDTLRGEPEPDAEAAEHARRKGLPLCTGVLDYFPDALLEVARTSRICNEQHNPGEPLHWAKEKSTDHPDSLLRHLAERGTMDTDGTRHSAKVAWRALAMLQRELDAEAGD